MRASTLAQILAGQVRPGSVPPRPSRGPIFHSDRRAMAQIVEIGLPEEEEPAFGECDTCGHEFPAACLNRTPSSCLCDRCTSRETEW